MGKINIGTIIAAHRKERGLTQEELAEYLGVSKPAVSKWESGQSYPDIMLLPVIAAYFNTSIDELLGYEAQMTKEEVRKLYRRLAEAYASEPFEKVYEECMEYVKKYRSCWKLLFSVAQLLVNHAMLAASPERVNEIYREAAGLFACVEKESGDAAMAKDALALRAYCSIALNQPAEAVDLLDDIEEQLQSTDILLAKACMLKGDGSRAISLLQRSIYQNILSAFGAFTDLMALYSDNPEKMDKCLRMVMQLGDVFGLRQMHPALYFTLYLTAGALFVQRNENDRALDMLEEYTELMMQKDIYPLKLHGNAFFDQLDAYFESLNLGTDVPRSQKLIKKDMKEVVLYNPAFAGLKQEDRYRRIVKRLESFEV
jgi:transcriptional regulator with XRE-family HTH domain